MVEFGDGIVAAAVADDVEDVEGVARVVGVEGERVALALEGHK